jgi:ubiquinone/menaquinone biosynthesis C-methylase UbiE
MNTRFQVFSNMLQSQGVALTPNTRILDFGCGSGELVKAAHEAGLDAYGCDFNFESEWIHQDTLAELRSSNRVRQIECAANGKVSPGTGECYRLPFDDSTFDVVISDQVFEHVQNYGETLAELARVSKPGAVMLHIFPSRYRLIEGHLNVPLATFFRPYWWLRLWASLGVRNQYQRGKSARETADENAQWLPRMTNYLSMRQIGEEFGRYFTVVSAEGAFMAQSRAKVFVLPALYRAFQSRCVFARKMAATTAPVGMLGPRASHA